MTCCFHSPYFPWGMVSGCVIDWHLLANGLEDVKEQVTFDQKWLLQKIYLFEYYTVKFMWSNDCGE